MGSLDPDTVPFFHDYLLTLRRMEKTPIKLTKKEKRFSLVDIAELVPQFAQQESVEEHKKYGWGIRLERDIDFLEQARVMMEVDGLVRLGCVEVERSKSGHEYLRKVEKFRLTYLGLYVLERYLNYFKS